MRLLRRRKRRRTSQACGRACVASARGPSLTRLDPPSNAIRCDPSCPMMLLAAQWEITPTWTKNCKRQTVKHRERLQGQVSRSSSLTQLIRLASELDGLPQKRRPLGRFGTNAISFSLLERKEKEHPQKKPVTRWTPHLLRRLGP